METIEINSLTDIDTAARQFVDTLQTKYNGRRCVTFYGGMGAGKTTFITAVCRVLKVVDKVSSPTFSIVNEYNTEDGGQVFHFDLYRIKDLEEAMSAGAEEYISGEDWCFIEWPEVLEPILPEGTVPVKIEVSADNRRTIYIDIL